MFVLSVMQYRYLEFDYKCDAKCPVKIFQYVFKITTYNYNCNLRLHLLIIRIIL